jgi:hypothetical protein
VHDWLLGVHDDGSTTTAFAVVGLLWLRDMSRHEPAALAELGLAAPDGWLATPGSTVALRPRASLKLGVVEVLPCIERPRTA